MSEITETMLAEWERLLAGPGQPRPWAPDKENPGGMIVLPDGRPVALVYAADGKEKRWWWECETTTAALIVAAVHALPALIAEVRRLRSSVPGTTPGEATPRETEHGFLIDAITQALEGEEVSDFALSFPVIAAAADLRSRLASAECARDEWRATVIGLEKENDRLRSLSPAPSPGTTETGTRTPYYLADGSEVLLPREEVERRRRAAAKALGAAEAVVRAFEGFRLPFRGDQWGRLLDLRNALNAIESAPAALPVSRGEATTKCDDHRPDGPNPMPDCRCSEVDRLFASPSPGSETPRGAEPVREDLLPSRRCPSCHSLPESCICPAPASPTSPGSAERCVKCGAKCGIMAYEGGGPVHYCTYAPDNHAEKEE